MERHAGLSNWLSERESGRFAIITISIKRNRVKSSRHRSSLLDPQSGGLWGCRGEKVGLRVGGRVGCQVGDLATGAGVGGRVGSVEGQTECASDHVMHLA
jgi:hypothetical protein